MEELSIFVDESGSFGYYEPHSPFYIIALVFHNQAVDISSHLQQRHDEAIQSGIPNCTFHVGPLIRREGEYKDYRIEERAKLFNNIFNFARKIDIKYHTIVAEKRKFVEDVGLIDKLTKQLSLFLSEHMQFLMGFDRVVVYYDYGQRELAKILVTAFNVALTNVEFKKALPTNYMLYQVADMICTLELLAEKAKRKMLSKSELAFFTSERRLRKTYLRAIHKKKF